jgi:hypothetical protein
MFNQTVLDNFMKKLLLLLFILSACASSDNGAYSKSETVKDELSKNIPLPWKKIDDEGSDLALTNKNTNSFFLFNSACRKYEASTLSVLTASMLTGIDNVEYKERTSTTHQDRDATLIVAKGSMDGVARFFRILTTQKNNCIYDYALISTSMKNLELDTADFNKFTQLLKLN